LITAIQKKTKKKLGQAQNTLKILVFIFSLKVFLDFRVQETPHVNRDYTSIHLCPFLHGSDTVTETLINIAINIHANSMTRWYRR
jgi:hypothetical protein